MALKQYYITKHFNLDYQKGKCLCGSYYLGSYCSYSELLVVATGPIH